jgi:hypothetical protein
MLQSGIMTPAQAVELMVFEGKDHCSNSSENKARKRKRSQKTATDSPQMRGRRAGRTHEPMKNTMHQRLMSATPRRAEPAQTDPEY